MENTAPTDRWRRIAEYTVENVSWQSAREAAEAVWRPPAKVPHGMRPIAQVFCLGLTLLLALSSSPFSARADVVMPPAAAATCTGLFSAGSIEGDPDAAVVSLSNPAGPLTGTITAYANDRKWTGTIGPSSEVRRDGFRTLSVTIRGDAPISGVEYTPTWANCSFRAPVAPRGYRARDVASPVLVLGNAQPAEPPHCARPYELPTVTRAFSPTLPAAAWQQDIQGRVNVIVSLDEHGVPQSASISSSPSVVINAPSLEAAKLSAYRAAVFRCTPVPGAYVFTIEYSGR
jgi:Gram-negative bacterial TonB protein C-terminal